MIISRRRHEFHDTRAHCRAGVEEGIDKRDAAATALELPVAQAFVNAAIALHILLFKHLIFIEMMPRSRMPIVFVGTHFKNVKHIILKAIFFWSKTRR